MNNSRSDGPQETEGASGNEKLSLEQTLGAIVIQMLREGRYITRHSLCIAVAGCIEKILAPNLKRIMLISCEYYSVARLSNYLRLPSSLIRMKCILESA
jgi:hypothetical protein